MATMPSISEPVTARMTFQTPPNFDTTDKLTVIQSPDGNPYLTYKRFTGSIDSGSATLDYVGLGGNGGTLVFNIAIPQTGCTVELTREIGGAVANGDTLNGQGIRKTETSGELPTGAEPGVTYGQDVSAQVKVTDNEFRIFSYSSNSNYGTCNVYSVGIQITPVLAMVAARNYQGVSSSGQIYRIYGDSGSSDQLLYALGNDQGAVGSPVELTSISAAPGTVRDQYVLSATKSSGGAATITVQPGWQNITLEIDGDEIELIEVMGGFPAWSSVNTKPIQVNEPRQTNVTTSGTKTVLVHMQRAGSLDQGCSWEQLYPVKVNDYFQMYSLVFYGTGSSGKFFPEVYKWTSDFEIDLGAMPDPWRNYREKFKLWSGNTVDNGSSEALMEIKTAYDKIFVDIKSSGITLKNFGINYMGHGQVEGLIEGLIAKQDIDDLLKHITGSGCLNKNISFLDWDSNCQTGSYYNIKRMYQYADYILASELNRRKPPTVPIADWKTSPEYQMHTYFDPSKYPVLKDGLIALINGVVSLWKTPQGKKFWVDNSEMQCVNLYSGSGFKAIMDLVETNNADLGKDLNAAYSGSVTDSGAYHYGNGRLDVKTYLEYKKFDYSSAWTDFQLYRQDNNSASDYFAWTMPINGIPLELEKPFDM